MKKAPLKKGYRRLYVELLLEVLDMAQSSTETDDVIRRRIRSLTMWKLRDEARRM